MNKLAAQRPRAMEPVYYCDLTGLRNVLPPFLCQTPMDTLERLLIGSASLASLSRERTKDPRCTNARVRRTW
jgi:hypothetical protein